MLLLIGDLRRLTNSCCWLDFFFVGIKDAIDWYSCEDIEYSTVANQGNEVLIESRYAPLRMEKLIKESEKDLWGDTPEEEMFLPKDPPAQQDQKNLASPNGTSGEGLPSVTGGVYVNDGADEWRPERGSTIKSQAKSDLKQKRKSTYAPRKKKVVTNDSVNPGRSREQIDQAQMVARMQQNAIEQQLYQQQQFFQSVNVQAYQQAFQQVSHLFLSINVV